MRGSHFIELFPEKIFPKILETGHPRGRRPSVRYRHLSTFPVKPSEIPVFRTSPSKGYNPSTEPQKALKSPRFELPAPLGHLPTCTPTCTQLRLDLLPTCPKYPVFQHFLDCKVYPPRDFREQLCHFARLSCIEKGLSKNMARILRGVKSPFASSAGGGGLFSFLPSLGPSLGLPCRPWPFFPAILSRGAWAFLDRGHFWPFLGSVLACIALSFGRWGFVSVRLRLGLCGACFMLLYTFAGVPCPPAKKKKPFLSLSLLVCLVCLSLCPVCLCSIL